MTKIKNAKGTSDQACTCGSWLNHWTRFNETAMSITCATRCLDDATVGGHVQKEGSAKTYIAPLCDKHNQETGWMEIDESKTPLVSANVSETCGKNKAFYGV